MSSYGVLPEGFVIKPLEQIKQDVADLLRADIDPGLDLTPSSSFGQAYLIFCEQLGQMWELAQAVGATWDPDAAIGAWMDNLASLSGVLREDATKSTVVAEVTTDQAVSVPAGDYTVSVDGNEDARFVNTEAIVTAGADTVEVAFEAEETGPVVANAGTLTVIETPVSGITGVTNPLDADLGTDIEEDDDLRLRREEELDVVGAGTVDSVRARLLQVADVEDAVVFENDTDEEDGDGRPPHSIHAIVLGGADADIWQAIWDVAGGGIATHGTETGNATDSRGVSQTVNFDRADDLEVYLEIDVDVIAADYPADGDDQIKAALIAYGDALRMGKDVIAQRIQKEAFAISGVHDITGFRLGLTVSPVGTINIVVDDTEIATFDTSRIVVATNPVTPT